VNGISTNKPSFYVETSDVIEPPKQDILPFVSKGGLKLEKAIGTFHLDFTGKTVLNIGASTGGFTDCALKFGAKFVWAVDVGSNQLDKSLRDDPRVRSLENTDIRALKPHNIEQEIDIVVVDLSFISLRFVLKNASTFI
jgi:23S rRNA (cytidine1920-2'-O)/16S rRNA (cytidine1409-2'-O)-methyltransferase